MDITVVVPLYNEAESLPELMEWINRVMRENSFSYEVIMVDDGSSDTSWDVLQQLRSTFPQLRGVKFQRNYGKSAALQVGFERAQGEVVITMDADLQDSPDEIPALRQMVQEQGYDIVSGWKKRRYDPLLSKRLPSKLFNSTVRMVSGIKLHDMNCGLKAYRKQVVKSIEVYGEMHRYIPVIAKQAGFKRIGEKEVHHQERKYGQTKFGMERFVNGFLDLFSVVFVSKFGKRPMHFFGVLGMLMFLIGGMATVWLIVSKLYAQSQGNVFRPVADQPLFYIALVTVVVGIQLFLAGFLGELIARSTPERNRYLIEVDTAK
ncbi:MAG: glycosyltransferase [Bacteroidales bacterium]|nr:glycosyltransferase [Bacteroidales bacterium]